MRLTVAAVGRLKDGAERELLEKYQTRFEALASKAAQAFASQRIPEVDARSLIHAPAPAWTFLTGPLSHLSSTDLRNKAKARATSVAKKAQIPSELPWKKDKPAEPNNPQPPREPNPTTGQP